MFGQPESYSASLIRILVSSFAVSFICVLTLSSDNPVRAILAFFPGQVDIGPIKDVSIGDAALAGALALILRITKAHDRVSTIFRIRESFDVRYFLRPLTVGVGLHVQHSDLVTHRNAMMSRIFYSYASFTEPKISTQLVRTASDAWSWYWCTVEAILIFFIFATIHLIYGTEASAGALLITASSFILIGWLQWTYSVTPSAAPQIEEILSSIARRAEIEASTREIMAR